MIKNYKKKKLLKKTIKKLYTMYLKKKIHNNY